MFNLIRKISINQNYITIPPRITPKFFQIICHPLSRIIFGFRIKKFYFTSINIHLSITSKYLII